MKSQTVSAELAHRPKLITRAIWLTVDLCAVVGAAVLLKLGVHWVLRLMHHG